MLKQILLKIKSSSLNRKIAKLGLQPYLAFLKEDGSVDYHGAVIIVGKNIKKLPFKFGHIYGSFNCSKNNLTTLKNSPHTVEGDFICAHNKLKNLVGAPKIIEGEFNCSNNKLKNLIGVPTNIQSDFNCSHNKLINLKDGPEVVEGNLVANRNQINTLKYMPNYIGYHVYLIHNKVYNIDTLTKIDLRGSVLLTKSDCLLTSHETVTFENHEIKQKFHKDEATKFKEELDLNLTNKSVLTENRKIKI